MTAAPTIDYEAMTREALRGVVRTVLSRVAKAGGLPGEHHFYVSFHTLAPGVTLSKRLREKYPNEMTIVLQHRFWDLSVFEDRFDVKLTFDGVPERIIVPFAALKVFYDPSVRYGMQFDTGEPGAEAARPTDDGPEGADFDSGQSARAALRTALPRRPRIVRKPRGDKEGPPPAEVTPLLTQGGSPRREPRHADVGAANDADPEHAATAPDQGAQIVRLDAFRKK